MEEKLFSNDITPADDLYRIIRDDERYVEEKSHMENLWKTYQPYADRDYLKKITEDFDARFWEMYLTCTLVHYSFNVVPKQMPKGPDIKIDHGSTTIWIEAVTPTIGDSSKPDSVPDLKMGMTQQIPDDQIILRYTNDISEKHKKYRKYLGDIIRDGDCYVIALNGCKTRHGKINPPRIVRSVLPIGRPIGTLDIKSKILNMQNPYMPSLKKASGSLVETDIFTKQEYNNISAVMFSNVDVCNPTSTMGDDFIIVRNPLASKQLPVDFPNVGLEYTAELSQNGITLNRRELIQH
ncbi:MAG: hypothetical protein HYX79_00450 [Chloroflexi bacterium]|nr:hypothetical protein [Chloroflexota bacterium]